MKGRGNQRVFILSTPTLALPHRRGRGLLGRFEISFVNHYRLYNYGLISKSMIVSSTTRAPLAPFSSVIFAANSLSDRWVGHIEKAEEKATQMSEVSDAASCTLR